MKRQRIHGNPRKNYSAEWKRWRKAQGWTQKIMALALGLSLKTIINIEKGHHRPSVSSRSKLAELQRKYREAQA